MLPINLHRFVLCNIPKGCWPDFFYHYTKKRFLPLICSCDGRLLATQATYLDDKLELKLGADLCIEFLERERGLSTSICDKLRKSVHDLINASCVEYPQALQVVPWVASLSSRKDSPRMWHSYTEGGGYCLVFSQRNLRRGFELLNAKSSSENLCRSIWLLMPCFYRGKHDVMAYIRAYFDDFLSSVVFDNNCNNLISHILVAATFIKEGTYAYEHEWRIAIFPSVVAYQDVEWCPAGSCRTPRLSVGLESCVNDFRRYLAGVMVSPHGDHEQMKAFAKKCRGNVRMKVEVSGLPTNFALLANHIDRKSWVYELHK